jgi:hypothetical protein
MKERTDCVQELCGALFDRGSFQPFDSIVSHVHDAFDSGTMTQGIEMSKARETRGH